MRPLDTTSGNNPGSTQIHPHAKYGRIPILAVYPDSPPRKVWTYPNPGSTQISPPRKVWTGEKSRLNSSSVYVFDSMDVQAHMASSDGLTPYLHTLHTRIFHFFHEHARTLPPNLTRVHSVAAPVCPIFRHHQGCRDAIRSPDGALRLAACGVGLPRTACRVRDRSGPRHQASRPGVCMCGCSRLCLCVCILLISIDHADRLTNACACACECFLSPKQASVAL